MFIIAPLILNNVRLSPMEKKVCRNHLQTKYTQTYKIHLPENKQSNQIRIQL